jgi:recombination protein RecT
VRERSESYAKKKAGPWVTDEGEMIKKTVVKQAQKYWPKTERSGLVDEAIHHLNTEGGEGFEAINSHGSKKYPVNDLQEWIRQAGAAASPVDLSTIWTKGLASIKPSKDLDAYNAFKRAVAERGDALKQPKPTSEVMDVEAKEVQP